MRELKDQGTGWMVFMDAEVSNDDGRNSSGGVRLAGAGANCDSVE